MDIKQHLALLSASYNIILRYAAGGGKAFYFRRTFLNKIYGVFIQTFWSLVFVGSYRSYLLVKNQGAKRNSQGTFQYCNLMHGYKLYHDQ